MSQHELQPEQTDAAHAIDKHISVTAGPGSGKTTVLVERYLHILRQHELAIDQIVAITFTNRAANEMRTRLREELDLILQTASENERPRWLNYKRTLDGGVITTIHGFCARLLREFPVEAHIDPQFLLLDEHRAAMLLESVVEETLTEFIRGGHVEISRLTLGVGRSRLAAALAQIYRSVRGQGLSLQHLALTTAANHASEEEHARALAELDRLMTELMSVRNTTPVATTRIAQLRTAWPEFRALLQNVPQPEALADYCRAVEDFRKPRPTATGSLSALVKALDELVWKKDLLGLVPQICLDLFAKAYALETVNVLARIDERLNDEKRKLSALDFNDLELRTLELLKRPEVQTRAAERYEFFLVDEFQDTNALQRQLLEQLALQTGRRVRANLFIVGDRKQSIYGFRGADVDVFQEMTTTLLAAGGELKPLRLNFRSQPPLINFCNHLFSRLFEGPKEADVDDLGYVQHERSEAKRELRDSGPLVELLITARASLEDDEQRTEWNLRELDAQQLAGRIVSLTQPGGVRYSDIALLFRAMTQVHVYESVFRRANIPYQTVLGRGFYEREEITDLIQLLRFLDNKTDELALAAVLRSPLCGISDNALLALRCAPKLEQVNAANSLHAFSQTRGLYRALRMHREIEFISEAEHELLDRAADLVKRLIARRHHYSIEDLLRFAVDQSEYMMVIAANFDGAQRLANVQRLFTLAGRFEASGTHLIRDFVRYVEEFEAIGSRESEGQIDQAANAVRLMTIHQAKGLEFPVVIIPDLHRRSKPGSDAWFLLDRHRGLTLKVPDGRGKLVAGRTFSVFGERHAWRELFESMRLLYVAATRAEDRLILSGATDELAGLTHRNDSWLKWIWQSLELEVQTRSGVIELSDDVQLQFTLNLAEEDSSQIESRENAEPYNLSDGDTLAQTFPLLQPIVPEREHAVHRFSVTQLINYQRCPRQYYFDRVLQLPSADEMGVWNNAEAPEPPANLTATLKGAVIHRFCERYGPEQDVEECLQRSFAEVVRLRQAELADRLGEVNAAAAIRELLPLAENYLASEVFARVELARKASVKQTARPLGEAGLWSELSFRLRRPLGVLSGALDKLLVTPLPDGTFEVEIIDFKTNRISSKSHPAESSSSKGLQAVTGSAGQPGYSTRTGVEGTASLAAQPEHSQKASIAVRTPPQTQFAFDFEAPPVIQTVVTEPHASIHDALRATAHDYLLQMQSYALAVCELVPALAAGKIRVTLHFLEPNLEFHLNEELLEPGASEHAIDEAMLQIVSSTEPEHFPVKTAMHCRMCNFLHVCAPGRYWLRER